MHAAKGHKNILFAHFLLGRSSSLYFLHPKWRATTYFSIYLQTCSDAGSPRAPFRPPQPRLGLARPRQRRPASAAVSHSRLAAVNLGSNEHIMCKHTLMMNVSGLARLVDLQAKLEQRLHGFGPGVVGERPSAVRRLPLKRHDGIPTTLSRSQS